MMIGSDNVHSIGAHIFSWGTARLFLTSSANAVSLIVVSWWLKTRF
jgi:hypothetical protein